MQKSGHMVLKGVNWVHNDKISTNGVERSDFSTPYKKSGYVVLKGVNWVHNDKFRSYGLERSQLGTQ